MGRWLGLLDQRTALGRWMFAACVVAGCSADTRDEVPGGGGGSSTAGGNDDGGAGATGDASSSGGATAGGGTGAGANAGGGGNEVDSSFIWIANTDEGTVSKLDTRTMVELARYRTSPMGQGKPSRTSVGPDGSVAVANRGGVAAQPSVEAGVTKVFASKDRCTDKNGNGTIETSTGKTDVLPWGEDECIAWHRPLDYWSNRPVAWAPVTAPDSKEAPKVWTAGASTCTNQSCVFDVLRLNGDTGVVEETIKVGPLMGPDFTGAGAGGGFPSIPGLPTIPGLGGALENYGPYGGASDAGGNFWTFTATTTHLVRVDAVTLAVRTWVVPNANGYGMTIDPKGRVFVCGREGISRFDPATEKWDESSAANVTLGYNGCMVDGKTKIWVGGGVDGGDPGLHSFDIDTLQWIDSHAVGPVKGVSIDIDGYVWGVSAGGGGGGFGGVGATNTAFRLDPKNGSVEKYEGLNNPYSYSDMTGFGLKAAGVIPII